MFRTLHGKLSVGLLTLLFLVGLLHVSLTYYTTRTYVEEVSQNLNRDLASDLAKHLLAKNLLRSDPATKSLAQAEMKQNMVLNPDIEIYILDPAGNIVDYSAAPGVVQLQRVSLQPIEHFLTAQGPLPILGDDPRHPGRRKVFSVARIPTAVTSRHLLNGYIYIILGGEKYDAVAAAPSRSYILRLSAWSIVGSLSLVAVAGIVLFGFLTRRLRTLTHQMEAFQQENHNGDQTDVPESALNPPLPRDGDEIERMHAVFTRMSERILSQIAQREQDEAQRREAVTNVSHDLRTPIAALQGYLETLLIKEGKLSVEEQRNYLLTAMKHAERLGKLVAELFELSKLDSQEMQPAWEDFSLAELVQDVAQQFALAAEKKGIRLETPPDSSLPFVRADIGLVERALENLIENALHHTPPGGTVKIFLKPASNYIQVELKDTGRGIAPEHLPHIFDRTYRVPLETAAENNLHEESFQGAGLGLAITRRIVELHGSTITAQSVPGQGTSFTFSLPLSVPQNSAVA